MWLWRNLVNRKTLCSAICFRVFLCEQSQWSNSFLWRYPSQYPIMHFRVSWHCGLDNSLFGEADLCIMGYLITSLSPPTICQLHLPVVKTKNVSRHCQGSAREQDCFWLTTTSINQLYIGYFYTGLTTLKLSMPSCTSNQSPHSLW